MLTVYIIVGIAIFFQAERGILDTISYLKLFKKMNSGLKEKDPIPNNKRSLFILIPVLEEQDIIQTTLTRFLKLSDDFFNIEIIFITTIREKIVKTPNQSLTTEEKLRQILEMDSFSTSKKSIRIMRENNANGNMATQLNYAIQHLSKNAPSESLYVIYNADSQISNTTISALYNLEKDNVPRFAFQQPCAYVSEMKPDAPNFLNALSVYQSWYCLGHESSLIKKYEKKRENNLGVIVGHGSGMSFSMNIENGGYPEKLLTEDLTFGFILSANEEIIRLLPALELADVPSKFSVFIRQKSVWFWNYLGYASCYKKMRLEGISVRKLLPLLWEGIGAGAYWFFSALFIIIPLFLGIITGVYQIVLISLFSTIIFCIVPQYILYQNLPTILKKQGFENVSQNVKSISFLKMLPSLCLINITDSVGAWIATYRYLIYCLTKKLPTKYKTEN